MIILCCTGLRPSEAIGLKEEDIIGTAYIKRGILTNEQISEGKTKNARRAVPLCELAIEQIKIMRERYPNTADILGMSVLHHTVGHSQSIDSIGVYAHFTTEEQEAIQTKLNDIFNLKKDGINDYSIYLGTHQHLSGTILPYYYIIIIHCEYTLPLYT